MQLTILFVVFSAVAQNAVAVRGLRRAQPTGVGKILAQVEQHWLDWALASVDEAACDSSNATGCSNMTNSTGQFTKSCVTVSHAILKTSAGDKGRMQSYMTNVCAQDELKGQLEELCLDFSQVLAQEMSEYQHDNLEGNMDLSKVCLDLFHEGYLARYAAKEAGRLQVLYATKAAEQQQKADEESAAQAKKEADAKAEVARQRLEQMANATATATQKREEAVRAAVEAQRKAEIVEEAEQTQKRLQKESVEAAAEAQIVKERLAHLRNKTASKAVNGTELIKGLGNKTV